MNKRDNDLVEKVNNELINNTNISDESKAIIKELLHSYENSTYKEWDDRHEWYAKVVDSMINDCSFKDTDLAEKMANNHPTLQQNFFRLCKKFIEKMSKKTYYDGRNESSVLACKKLNEVLENENVYVPFI